MKIEQNLAVNAIKQFIRINHTDNRLHIDFDSMCVCLMRNFGRMFSAAEFERALSKELKKIEGLPICEAMFDEIAKYINNMTIYMHQQSEIKGKERNEKLEERFHKYAEDLARAKKK